MRFKKLFESDGDHEYWASMPHEHLHAETHRTLTNLGHEVLGKGRWSLHRKHELVAPELRHDGEDGGDYIETFDHHMVPHGWPKGGFEELLDHDVVHHPNGSALRLDTSPGHEISMNFVPPGHVLVGRD